MKLLVKILPIFYALIYTHAMEFILEEFDKDFNATESEPNKENMLSKINNTRISKRHQKRELPRIQVRYQYIYVPQMEFDFKPVEDPEKESSFPVWISLLILYSMALVIVAIVLFIRKLIVRYYMSKDRGSARNRRYTVRAKNKPKQMPSTAKQTVSDMTDKKDTTDVKDIKDAKDVTVNAKDKDKGMAKEVAKDEPIKKSKELDSTVKTDNKITKKANKTTEVLPKKLSNESNKKVSVVAKTPTNAAKDTKQTETKTEPKK